MSRTFTTIVLTTLMSSALFAQTSVYTNDPIADLTRNIISRYLPQATTARTAAHYGVASPAIGYGLYNDYQLPTFQPLTRFDLGYGFGNLGLQQPLYGGLDLTPRMVMPRPQMFMSLPSAYNTRLPSFAPAAATVVPNLVEPGPLSMSMASTNGVYAIQAVVPTEGGQEQVNLNGTRAEVQTQLNALSPKTRTMMRRSLGM